ELDVVRERVDRLEGHRIDAAKENIEQVADCPAPFEPRTELCCLSSRARARDIPPCRSSIRTHRTPACRSYLYPVRPATGLTRGSTCPPVAMAGGDERLPASTPPR